MADDEESRLMRSMERKANQAFDQKRRDALQKYHGSAKNFSLSEDTTARAAAPKATAPAPSLSEDEVRRRQADVLAEERRRNQQDEERRRKDAEERGPGELERYMKAQAAQEAEFKARHEEEDRRRREEVASIGTSSLAKYELELSRKDREAKQHREDEDRKRKEEMSAQENKLRSYREKQEAEEREFRRKREDDERAKAEKLGALERADRERREAISKQSRDEEARRRNEAAAQAQRPTTQRCTTCNQELSAEQAVFVKGRVYCYRDSLAAGADLCAGCNKPIVSGQVLKAASKKYHPDCLKCEKCNVVLSEGFRMRRNKMLCINCSQGL